MKTETIGFERLPTTTPNNMAFRYLVGFAPIDTDKWWSDFVVKGLAFDRDSAIAHAKHLQDTLKRGPRFVPELDTTRMWRVCIVDINQYGKRFSDK